MKTASPGLLEMQVVRVNAGGMPPGPPPPPPPLFLREKFVLATTLIFCEKRFLAVLVRLVIFGGLGSTCKHMRADGGGETEGRKKEEGRELRSSGL